MVSNFKVYQLGQLGRIVTGKTPPTNRAELFGDEYPFITPVDMHDVKNANSTERSLSAAGAQYQHRLIIPPGSIAVSCIGWQMGKSIIITRPSFTNQQLNTIIPHDWVNSDFLYYTLVTLRQKFFSIGSGVGVRTPILNKSAFSVFEVSLPSFDFQCRIAAILSAYDDLIENNKRRIAILDEMARRIYEEWFVNYRFPGHEAVRLVESEIGPVPEGWDVDTLDKALVLQRGFDLPAGNRELGQFPIIAASGAIGYHKEKRAEGPSVVTGRSGTIGKVIYVTEDFWPLNTALWVKEFVRVSPLFGFHMLSGIDFLAVAGGAAVPTLNRNHVHAMKIAIPSKELIVRFDEVVDPLQKFARNLELKNTNLRQTRDLLLPRLISGELDVSTLPVPEDMVA